MLRVTVCCSPAPRDVVETEVLLPIGATVADAVEAWGRCEASLGIELAGMQIGVWGKPADRDRVLRDLDRVELCRALRVDPKVARRERFRRQGARAAGLFAQRRPNGKAGY